MVVVLYGKMVFFFSLIGWIRQACIGDVRLLFPSGVLVDHFRRFSYREIIHLDSVLTVKKGSV